MTIDTRDWYKNLIRKKTNYVERSTFRRPATDDEVIRVLGPPTTPRPPRITKVRRSYFWLSVFWLIGFVALYVVVKFISNRL